MAEETVLGGSSSVTVARVIARARVSRRLFYELFTDVEDCLVTTFDWSLAQARAAVAESTRSQTAWLDRMRSGLAALLRFFDRQPLLAQLCVVHAVGGGRRMLERRSAVIAELTGEVDGGRALCPEDWTFGPIVAEGAVGALSAVLYTRLLERAPGGSDGSLHESDRRGEVDHGQDDRGEAPALIDLYGELMSILVLPYLGAAAAARERSREPPQPPPGAPTAANDPIAVPASQQVGARLTYRTVRVLRAIAELPAGNNREVAERAGIVDQGQISKILTRFQHQGLAVNRRGVGQARGAPNAWWLTERGEKLERDLRERAPTSGAGQTSEDASDSRQRDGGGVSSQSKRR